MRKDDESDGDSLPALVDLRGLPMAAWSAWGAFRQPARLIHELASTATDRFGNAPTSAVLSRFLPNRVRIVDPGVKFTLSSLALFGRLRSRAFEGSEWLHVQALNRAVLQRLREGYAGNRKPFPPESNYPGPKAKDALLYLVVRILRPSLLVETGVDQGVSSCFLLDALEANGQGELVSIDRGGTTESGNPVGWLVESARRKRWTLILKPAEEALRSLDRTPDVFFHDSLHTYDHMRMEFEWAALHLRRGGLLISDDIGCNAAFRDLLSARRSEFSPVSEHVVGMAVRR